MVTQPLSHRQLKQLFADLNPDRVKSRKQGTSNLSYLEAWDVRRSLIRVFGYGGYSYDTEATIVKIETDVKKANGGTTNFRVTATAHCRLYIPQLDAYYSETAAASQAGADIGEVTDFAIKTAESDAFKRCAVNLGTQFGLSLYNSGATADVVQVSFAAGQTAADRALLEAEFRAEAKRANDELTAAMGANPGTGEIVEPALDDRVLGGEVPEDDTVDGEVDPAALAQNQQSVAAAFGGKRP